MTAPVVEHFNETIQLNSVIPAADLISVSDADGDSISRYIIQDFQSDPTGGFFRLRGSAFANGQQFTIDAADLADLEYVAGSRVAWEGYRFIAIDSAGEISTENVSGRLYSVRPNVTRPTVLTTPITALANEATVLASEIRAFDPDGFPITQFFIRDSEIDNGFLEFNGEAIPQGEYRQFSAQEFGGVTYNTSGEASLEEIQVFAFDGQLWSEWTRINITTIPNVNVPVAQFSSASVSSTQLEVELLPLADLAVVTDDDGNSIKSYQFLNTSPHANHGELVFRGVVQPRQTFFTVQADELDQVFYQAPDRNLPNQQIRFRAFDGEFFSAPGTISIETDFEFVAPPVTPSLSNPGFVYDEQLEVFGVDTLFQRVDEGGQTLSFEVYDGNPFGNRSARFELNNDPLDPLTIHEFDAATINSSVRLRTGDFNNRSRDDILVRARTADGGYSPWSKLIVRTEPEHIGAHFTGSNWLNVPGIPTDAQGRLVLSYSFLQDFPDYPTGSATDDAPPNDFTIFNQSQRESTRLAFESFAAVANIQFVEVSDTSTNVLGQRGGIFRFGNYGQDNDGAQAFAFLPGTAPQAGDIWFNRTLISETRPTRDPQLTFGGSSYTTLLHELGHAVGFAHVFDGAVILPPETQTDDFSVLSTFTGQRPDGLFPTTPQLYDVESLQALYGANPTYRDGDTVWSLATTWAGRPSFTESVYDAGGNDTLSLVGSDPLVGFNADGTGILYQNAIDLTPGGFSTFNGHLNNVSIALRAEIENAIGSDLTDTILGNHLSNTIDGGAGDDFIEGSAGNDFITGGAGNDIFQFGVGDGQDVVNEQRLAGRDSIRLTQFPTLDVLEDDVNFRLEGRDLVIDLNLDNSDVNDGSIRIVNQVFGRFRVETLELGGTAIDLVDLTSQLSAAPSGIDSFRITSTAGQFGQLVAPV